MAMVHHDREHLERVRSPLVKVLRSHREPLDEKPCAGGRTTSAGTTP